MSAPPETNEVVDDERHNGTRHGEETSRRRPRKRQRASWASRLNAQLEDFPLERTTQALAVALVLVSMLAIGGVHPPVMLVLGVLASTLVFAALALRATDRRLPLGAPVYILWGLAAVCLVQLVPLPMGVLRAVSPVAADIWSRALLPLDEAGPSFAPLSLDPGATWVEALRWFSYGAVFVGAAAMSSRLGCRWAAASVFGSACLAALIAVAHGLVGLDKVYTLYAPGFRAEPWHVGPLLNPNNLAGYLNLGALCGLGLLFENQPIMPRWLNAIGVAVLVGVVVGAASRGGVLTLAVGVAMLVVALERSRRRRAQSRAEARRARLILFATVAFGAALAVLGSHTKTWHDLLDENTGKLQMVSWVRPLLGDFPWFGLGRGAFESVFPAYQPRDGGIVFTHVENFAAQWLVEWGIPVGVAALFALAWSFRPGRLGVSRSSAAAGIWCGSAALLFQNLADLGLEIPALCIALAFLLGALWGAAAQREAALLGPVRHAPWAIRLGVVAATAGLLLSAGVARGGMRLLDAERTALHEGLLESKAPRTAAQRKALRGELRGAMLRHPAEPYFSLLGAALAFQEQDESEIPWLQRALERSRANGRAHLLLAQVLERHHAKLQALMELRLAIANDRSLVDAAADVASRWAVDEPTLARMIPSGELAGATWDALGARIADKTLARQCDRHALEADERLTGPMFRLASEKIAARTAGTGCVDDADSCGRELEAFARGLEKHAPSSSRAGEIRARWLSAQGKHQEASRLLSELCDAVEDRIACLRTRTELAAKVVLPEALTLAERALLAAVCIEERACAEAADWVGGLHAGRGEWAAAGTLYARAIQHEETDERLSRLAEASSRAGMSGQALRTLERTLGRRGGHDPVIEARIQELRKQVMDGVLR
jgi:hypothetical protein